jgi:CHAT domain-containing protein/tetratricopeptide (TPR) repeat protein
MSFFWFLFWLLILAPGMVRADGDPPASVASWLEKGSLLLTEGKYDSARLCFDHVAALADAGKSGAFLQALNGSATSLAFTGRIDTAGAVVEYALAQMPPDTGGQDLALAEAYALLAYVHSFYDRTDSALAWNAKSLELRRTLLGDSHFLLATNYYTSGIARGKQGLYREAVADFQHALRLCLPTRESIRRRAQIQMLLGNALRECHELDRAIHHLDTSKAMLRNAGLDHSYPMVSALVYTAFCEGERGDLLRALALYDSAAELSKRVAPANTTAITSIRASMGRIYLSLGDLDRALEMGADALERLGLLGTRSPSGDASIHADMARALIEKGEVSAAREHARMALTLRLDALGPGHQDVAAAYEGLAAVETKMGSHRDALTHLREALRIRTAITSEASPAVLAGPMLAIAHVQREMGDLQAAEVSIAGVLRMRSDGVLADPQLEARAYQELADVRAKEKNLPAALALYDSALSVLLHSVDTAGHDAYARLVDLSGGQSFLQVLKKKGTTLRTLAPEGAGGIALKRAALETYEISCRTLLSLRSRYASEGSKFRLVEDLSQVCGWGVSLAVELLELTKDRHYLMTAFSFAELNKAGMLLDGIRQSKVMSFAGVPDSLVVLDRSLKTRLTALELDLSALRDDPVPEPVKLQNLRWDIQSLREESRMTSERLRQISPAYAHLVECDALPVLADVQSAIDDSTLLLEYSFGPENAVVFLISKHGVEYRNLGPREKIETAVSALTGAIRMVDYDRFVEASCRAYALLVSPARQIVSRYTRLVVIPDGSICTVPFETLMPGVSVSAGTKLKFSTLPFLVRSHEILVSPSARLLCEPSAGETRSGVRDWKFAGFAPVFNDSSAAGPVFASNRSGGDLESDPLRSVSVNGKTFRALPHSDREVTNIAAEFDAQGLRSQTFVNERASEENFKQNAAFFTHLHVATHGFVNAQDPARSALLFAPPAGSGTGEDGVLYAAEAYNLHLHADLVVLSSCESGVGRFVSGEGVYALMRGFLYSGARNVMYSLWQVMDRHTSELMQSFYEEALTGMRASKALRLAKLRMLSNERTAFPFSWAGFVLVGR